MRKQSFPRGIPKEDFGNENEAGELIYEGL